MFYSIQFCVFQISVCRTGKLSEVACPIFFKFEKILSHAHGNFEEQNQVLESSIIMINFSIIMYIIIILYN